MWPGRLYLAETAAGAFLRTNCATSTRTNRARGCFCTMVTPIDGTHPAELGTIEPDEVYNSGGAVTRAGELRRTPCTPDLHRHGIHATAGSRSAFGCTASIRRLVGDKTPAATAESADAVLPAVVPYGAAKVYLLYLQLSRSVRDCSPLTASRINAALAPYQGRGTHRRYPVRGLPDAVRDYAPECRRHVADAADPTSLDERFLATGPCVSSRGPVRACAVVWNWRTKFGPPVGFADRRRDQGCRIAGLEASVHTDELARSRSTRTWQS